VSSKFEKVHGHMANEAQRWSLREQFLDTDRLRHISYGNLVFRREAHLFLTHGVIVSIVSLLFFWLVSANWNNLMAVTGLFRHEDKINVQCYEIVTNVTQLPPPPPIAPEPPKAKACDTPIEAPPNVGKIKKVADAPAEQTLATQKEIRQAIQQGANGGDGAGCDNTVLEFVECQDPPRLEDPNARPNYPEMARIAGIEGRVFVRVLIGEEGRAMKAEIVKRVPADCSTFDKEAVRFAMTSKFIPGKQNGKRVRVWMTIPVRFKLGEG
jgi:protein TonB